MVYKGHKIVLTIEAGNYTLNDLRMYYRINIHIDKEEKTLFTRENCILTKQLYETLGIQQVIKAYRTFSIHSFGETMNVYCDLVEQPYILY